LTFGHGTVHDSFGAKTGQTDLIISNEHQPFNYPADEPGEYMVEGVSAVGEVKALLTGAELNRCLLSATKHKQLVPQYDQTDTVLNPSDYYYETNGIPPYLLIAFDSRLRCDTIQNRLEASETIEPPEDFAAAGMKPQHAIDAVCVLGKCVLWNFRTTEGPIVLTGSDGNRVTGWVKIDTSAPLSWTLGWLHANMPRVRRDKSIFRKYIVPQQRVGARMLPLS
jgi:hypothetical protein